MKQGPHFWRIRHEAPQAHIKSARSHGMCGLPGKLVDQFWVYFSPTLDPKHKHPKIQYKQTHKRAKQIQSRSEGLPERDISSPGVMGWGLEVAGNSSAAAQWGVG